MGDQLVAETTTWQHTKIKTYIRASGGIRTHHLSTRTAANQSLRSRGHRDRQFCLLLCRKPWSFASTPHYTLLNYVKKNVACHHCLHIGIPSPGLKLARREADPLNSFSSEIKNQRRYTYASRLSFVASKWTYQPVFFNSHRQRCLV